MALQPEIRNLIENKQKKSTLSVNLNKSVIKYHILNVIWFFFGIPNDQTATDGMN